MKRSVYRHIELAPLVRPRSIVIVGASPTPESFDVSYLAEDDACRAIAGVFEGVSDPHRLIQAGEIARACAKPLVIHKLATGEHGRQVALSHTGTMAGSNEAWRALFRRIDAIVVENVEDLAETAAFFAKAPSPRARGTGVVSISGGFCISHADKAELYGVSLPEPRGDLRDKLSAFLPAFAQPTNPCDVTGAAVNNAEAIPGCYEAFLASPDFETVVLTWNYASEELAMRTRELPAAIGASIREASSGLLPSDVALAILRGYGVPMAEAVMAESVDHAVEAALNIGLPVAVKVESRDIAHKTEVGGVALNLRTLDEVRLATERVLRNVRSHRPSARIDGVLVQPMIRGDAEVVVSGRVDPLFGPVVTVGLGGILVELLYDTVLEFSPVPPVTARQMFDRLRGRAMLHGFRGKKPVDLDSLARAVSGISRLIADRTTSRCSDRTARGSSASACSWNRPPHARSCARPCPRRASHGGNGRTCRRRSGVSATAFAR